METGNISYLFPSPFLLYMETILLKVNKKQLKKILDKTCAAAVKVGMDDIDNFRHVCDLGTHKITQSISDRTKIEKIETLVRTFCYVVIEESGLLARMKRLGWKYFVMGEIEAVFASIEQSITHD
jgi:hypothetical protein